MSLVYITHHNENIFDVEREKPEKPAFAKPKLNVVKRGSTSHRDRLNVEYKKHSMQMLDNGVRLLTDAKKSYHRTMGCANVPLDPPCAFLRKNQGVKWRRENLHVCPKGGHMPPLPPMGKKEKKPAMVPNFVRRNIRCARTTVKCPPPPRFVDTPIGERQNLLNSGLVPQYVCRKDFGQVPVYIHKTKKMLSKMHDICCKEQARLMELCAGVKGPSATATDTTPSKGVPGTVELVSSRGPAATADKAPPSDGSPPELPGMRIMKQPERNEILVGLRAHLNEMTKIYQSQSLLIDSENKRQRKGKLESDLRQLEQDILMLETSPIIYVSLY